MSIASDSFDPYYSWLGIPRSEQPPNHYRLLGISLFEQEPDVIEAAADQRMGFLRQMAHGKHSSESQKLLNEVSVAKLCLLDPQRRTSYDFRLKSRIATATAPPVQHAVSQSASPIIASAIPIARPVAISGAPSHEAESQKTQIGVAARRRMRARVASALTATIFLLIMSAAIAFGAFVLSVVLKANGLN